MKIILAQLNNTVGDIEGNASKAIDVLEKAQESDVDLVVFAVLIIINVICILCSISFTQTKFKNVQVLDIQSRSEMKEYMKSISKDLDVKCSYCHDLNDKSIDTDIKNIAREMIIMQQEINKQYFTVLGDSLDKYHSSIHVSCWTCHRGSNIPQHIRPNK